MIALVTAILLTATPGPTLNAVETARAEAIMQEIRCVVCAGQSIADSDAALAQDMRHFIRVRVARGDDAASIRAELAQSYRDEVLLRPPFDWRTLPLWLAPLIFLLAGGGMLIMASRSRREP
ncbi:cytochrome c-type biogenesis protein [Hyphobacterium marinum]|uniref:Cytochrome c-type biogenesis protein n=1 Tax=Hyphobacterium marinum TaxID=3116574 RepID=A0ABU7M0G6_9PROT|nr:cytochrome c-type biogenesis protein [Hyphobacterium sp. Y6023]MEE2567311.1 cytochrome c-type biogenesis protein [Hyphobacterium sp. Y6023]